MSSQRAYKNKISSCFWDALSFLKNHSLFIVVLSIYVYCFYGITQFEEADVTDYVSATVLGVIFASIELASRYKDDPLSVLKSAPGLFYLSINGLTCFAGLYITQVLALRIEVEDSLPMLSQRVMDIISASLSTLLIMRSSIAKLGQNSEIDLGLSIILNKLLSIVDREVDRLRAESRSQDIVKQLGQFSFDDVKKEVIPHCLAVMQNLTVEEKKQLLYEVEQLGIKDRDTTKKFRAGLVIYDLVGSRVLKSVIEDLVNSDIIKKLEPQADKPSSISESEAEDEIKDFEQQKHFDSVFDK